MVVQTRMDEQTIVGLWERQSIAPSALSTLRLRVVFRGLPSDAGGPDYQDAILSVANQRLLTGDVEFHVNESDWYRHGHHLNPSYNCVILHVVWVKDAAETRRQDGSVVPVLVLHGNGPAVCTTAAPETAITLPHYPCVATFARWSRDDLLAEVRRLGSQRFEDRRARFEADLTVEGPDQVAYAALLQGLGYSSNRRAFADLADAVPYAWLQSIAPEQRAATLLEAARLGPRAAIRPPAHLLEGRWRLSRLRPANHPTRRLEGISLLMNGIGPALARSMSDAVSQAQRPADLRRQLVARADDGALIGAGRADELAISVVLPLVAALDGPHDHARELFEAYPSAPPNRWTRYMLGLLRQAGHDIQQVRSAREHQGLHHLYHTYCRGACADACPLCQRPTT